MTRLKNLSSPLKGLYQGWWVTGLGTATLFISHGTHAGGAMGLFFVALLKEFGWSRTMISGAFSLVRIEGSLLGPVEGYLIDKLGPNWTIFVGFILVGAAFFLLAGTTHPVHFYISRAIMTLGAGMGGTLAVLATLNWWFKRKLNTAMGLSMAGVELGALLTPILAWSMAMQGWRNTAIAIGISLIALSWPLSRGFKRPKGLEEIPSEIKPVEPKNFNKQEREPQEFTVRQAINTRAFWTISIVMAASGLTTTTFYVHSIPHLVDIGLSEVLAATVYTIYGMSGFATRAFGSPIGDRIDKRYVIWVFCSIQALGLLVLGFAKTLPVAIFAAILSGIGHGGRGPVLFSIRTEYFGKQRFGTLIGLGNLVTSVSSITAPVLLGWMFDTQGTYLYGFSGAALGTLVGAALIMTTKQPHLPKEEVRGPIT
jgi:MFS family permease